MLHLVRLLIRTDTCHIDRDALALLAMCISGARKFEDVSKAGTDVWTNGDY